MGKGGRCVGLTTSFLCADCLKILGASTSWSPEGLSRPVQGELYVGWNLRISSACLFVHGLTQSTILRTEKSNILHSKYLSFCGRQQFY